MSCPNIFYQYFGWVLWVDTIVTEGIGGWQFTMRSPFPVPMSSGKKGREKLGESGHVFSCHYLFFIKSKHPPKTTFRHSKWELYQIGVSENRGKTKWMVKIMENPINPWDDLGGFYPLFSETPKYAALGGRFFIRHPDTPKTPCCPRYFSRIIGPSIHGPWDWETTVGDLAPIWEVT